ncbi:MAG: hypothetical protein ABL986_02910 [Vicinamibacterales bacterium]
MRTVSVLVIAALCLGACFSILFIHIRSGPRQQSIGIRWAPDTGDLARQAAERRLRLQNGEASDSGTWTYRLQDHATASIRRIVTDPLVADTSHIDRQAFRIIIDAPGIPTPVRRLLERDLGVVGSLVFGVFGLVALWTARREITLGAEALRATRGLEVVVALTALIVGFAFFVDNGQGVDENIHYDQILRFARGDWSLNPTLTTIPGFHALVAGLAWLTGGASELSVRVIVFLLSIATVLVFYALARALQPEHAGIRTLQFALLPVLFPQFFLVYTDVTSLLFVLAMMLAASHRRYRLAGALGLLSCLVRQNNIVWVAFVMLWSYLRASGWTWRPIGESLVRYWTFIATGVAFLLFVAANNGQVALGDDAASHPLGVLRVTNLFFALFLSCFLFLPLWLGSRREWLTRLTRIWPWLTLVIMAAVFWFGFVNDHPHNNERADFFLPNAALIYFSQTALRKLLFLVPVAIASLGVMVAPLRGPWWLLCPFTMLFLLPEWLVVPRYYLVPWSLWLVAREPAAAWSERLQVLWFVVASVGAFLIVERAWGWI